MSLVHQVELTGFIKFFKGHNDIDKSLTSGTHPEDDTCITYSTNIYCTYTVYTLVYIKQFQEGGKGMQYTECFFKFTKIQSDIPKILQ